jgi:predicted transcriptional regulator
MARMTIEFPDKLNEILEKLAKENKMAKVDVLRRALALYSYVAQNNEVKVGTNKLSITNQEDKVVKDILL